MDRFRLLSLTALLGAAAAAGWWWSPLSPVAFDRPAAALASGDAEAALEGYLRLASAPISRQDEALWQAALIAEIELSRIDHAATLLRRCVDFGGARAPEAAARLARLETDPIAAAEQWMIAADLAPTHDSAGRWLLNAGEAAMTAGDASLAEAALWAATEREDAAVLAFILLGRSALEADPTAAHGHYDAALTAGASGITAELARAGRDAAASLMDEAVADDLESSEE